MTGRDRTVVGVVLALAAVAGVWLLLIQPKRAEASHLGDEIKAAQTQLDDARAQVAAGEAARRSFAGNYSQLAQLGEAVPADDNVPSLIFQVQSAASSTGVDFRSLTMNAGSGSASSSPSPPPPSTSTAGKRTATPAPATQSATASLPPGVTVGPAGFPTEPFNFTFTGNFFHLSNFLGKLERFVVARNRNVAVSGRLMTLNAISLGAGPKGFPQITASVNATTYLVPTSEGLFNGASPSGSAGSTQSVSGPGATAPSTSSAQSAATPVAATGSQHS
jgi:hypothetical protein